MRRMFVIVFLLPLFLTAVPGHARAELKIPPCETPCDSLREGLTFRGVAIRLEDDPERERAFMAEILAEHAGNDLALRELARTIHVHQGLRASLAMVKDHDLSGAGLEAELSDSAWLFMEGILQYYRARFLTALSLLEEAAAGEPDWHWVDYYILNCKAALLRPDEELQPLLDPLLRHHETRTQVLINLFRESNSALDPVFGRRVLEALEQGPTSELGRTFLDCTRGASKLKSTGCTAGDVESFWRQCVTDHGDLAYAYLFRFLDHIDEMLPLRDALILLDNLAQSCPYPDDILLVKADILGKLGQYDQQLVLLDGLENQSLYSRYQQVQTLNSFMKADELNQLLDDIAFEYGLTYFAWHQKDVYPATRCPWTISWPFPTGWRSLPC